MEPEFGAGKTGVVDRQWRTLFLTVIIGGVQTPAEAANIALIQRR